MRPIFTALTHTPPKGSLPLTQQHVRYMHKCASMIVRHIDKVESKINHGSQYNQIDRMILEAASLLIINGTVMPIINEPTGLEVVEHARGMAALAFQLIDQGMTLSDTIIAGPDDTYTAKQRHDFLRACEILAAAFSD